MTSIFAFTSGGTVVSSGSPVEVTTPYAHTDLDKLKFTQSADVMYIVTQILRRAKLHAQTTPHGQLQRLISCAARWVSQHNLDNFGGKWAHRLGDDYSQRRCFCKH